MPDPTNSHQHKKSDPKAFSALENVLVPYTIPGRTPSASFLVWFLQVVYRLEQVEAQDAVCDKKLDKGVDAIFVNDGDEEIVLFQAKRSTEAKSTLGDTDLKEFIGALAQFRTEASIAELASTTKNPELQRLIKAGRIAEKVGSGYVLRPVFVTNVAKNHDAQSYINHAANAGDDLDLWDLERLTPVLNQMSFQKWFVEEESSLKVNPKTMYSIGDGEKPNLIMAAVTAKQLVTLIGISDTRIFAQNVRLGLGKTRVNSELVTSIKDPKEHQHFLAYHNGLTIVAKDITYTKGNISIKDYSVSNGCQSLLSLYNNISSLTNNLTLPVRIVKVGEDRSLAASIAYKTNNQNPISLRDLSANNATQNQIKAEFDFNYGFASCYMIKRGAIPSAKELANEFAGQLLLSLYVRSPWSAHQKYKIFGELQSEIFKYGIAAEHIRFAQLAMSVCDDALLGLPQAKIREYGLTRFILLYFLGELLRKEKDGESILDHPGPYLRQGQHETERDLLEEALLAELRSLATYATTEINYYVKDHGDEAYDYKSDFKSEKQVNLIKSEMLKTYDKDKFRDKVDPFRLPVVVIGEDAAEIKATRSKGAKLSKIK